MIARDGCWLNVGVASGGQFRADPAALFGRGETFTDWARGQDPARGTGFDLEELELSDRDTQPRPADNPRHSLGKSSPGYSPTGPFLVTPEEFDDPSDIARSCALNGVTVRGSSTADLIFGVAELVQHLRGIVTLLPGDLILTGTRSGVGTVMNPPRFLTAKNTITSSVAGAGEIRLTFADPEEPR